MNALGETKTFPARRSQERDAREGGTVLRKRYGISVDINRASRTKAGPLPDAGDA